MSRARKKAPAFFVLLVTIVFANAHFFPIAAHAKEILFLTGEGLAPEQVVRVARLGVTIKVTDEAWARVRKSHQILIRAAEQCQPIYGVTTGVGANKDKVRKCPEDMLTKAGKISEAAKEASKAFNRGLLFAHSAGAGKYLPDSLVRAIMVVRLNTILSGGTGIREIVARRFLQFLNIGIHPLIPARGSVGQADITLLSHIGLAMIGEWRVKFKGREMPAREALDKANLPPLKLWAKDALSILSSNAYSAADAALAYGSLIRLVDLNRLVFALSLEALNGNVAPFLHDITSVRKFRYVIGVSEDVRHILKSSYLWKPHGKRPLQDPLSYRTAAYGLGAVERALAELRELLMIQLNSSDDNPGVVLGALSERTWAHPKIKPVDEPGLQGAVIPSANFSPLPWVISLERTGIAVAHISTFSAQRTLRLSEPVFTKLKSENRFMGTKYTIHAFGAIQKVPVALASQNRELANPASLNFAAVAQNIEDVATNAPHASRRLRTMVNNLRYLLGIELLHAAQAVDLRKGDTKFSLAPLTYDFYRQFRARVKFLGKDNHILTNDITAAFEFLRTCVLSRQYRVEWKLKAGSKTACINL